MLRRSRVFTTSFFLFAICLNLTNSAYAFTPFVWLEKHKWQPIPGLKSHLGTTSNQENLKGFPITDPSSNQFYRDTLANSNQKSAFFYGFSGTEWRLSPSWLMQTNFDYIHASPFSPKGFVAQSANTASADSYYYSYGILTRQLLAEGKLSYHFQKIFHPFALLGLGAAFNQTDNYYNSAETILTLTRADQNHTTTSLSYALGFGLDMDIAKQIRFGIGYRFADLGKAKLSNAGIDGAPVSGTLSQSHLFSHEILAQFTFTI